MAYTLIANTATNTTVTSPAINTTGANLIVISLAGTNPVATPTDSKGNTYTGLTGSIVGGDEQERLFYSFAPTVGTGHTFTQGAAIEAMCIAAFSGAVASPFDVENGATLASGTSLAAGSVSPTQKNELIVTGLLVGGTNSAHTIGSGFTITNALNGTSGVRYGGAMAYLIQVTKQAVNPTWSWTGTVEAAVRIATFKNTPVYPLSALGAG